MKVTVENKKGLNKDLKVFVDKKTMNTYMDENGQKIAVINLMGILFMRSCDNAFFKIEEVLKPFFEDFYSIEFSNYPVDDHYLHQHEIIKTR